MVKWLDKYAMGGALPGATGMMYARTQDPAPSNGPYAKKTKASAQSGKAIPVPTTADSLRVYNAALATLNYYKNDKRHSAPEIDEFDANILRSKINEAGSENLNHYRHMYKELTDPNEYVIKRYRRDYKESPKELLNKVGKAIVEAKSAPPGITYYKDAYPSKIDINAPSAIIDERIDPQGWINFKSNVTNNLSSLEPAGSVTGMWYYDPLAVKPYNMRTEEEKIKWNKKYGKETPKKPVSKPIPKPEPKSEPAPVVTKQPTPEQPTPQPKPLYEYEGEQVMAPVPSGGGAGMVGFKKKDGTIEYIKPEDYKRMGVPKYGQDYIKTKQKMQKGGVIKDDRGQWAYPGEVTEIGSNDITMQGVDYPVLGVSDTGDTQMMYPDQDYKFDGNKVTEFPMAQDGGWLDKYK